MIAIAAPTEPTVERRVFEAWSIQVPAVFAETFVAADGYWHGHDEHRSVSLTSDDLEWARRVWLSIRSHAAPAQPSRRRGRTGERQGRAALGQ